jgi:hypothetical protein
LVTTAIFSFIWRWDDFLSALLFVRKSNMYPASLALKLFLRPQLVVGLRRHVLHEHPFDPAGAADIRVPAKIPCGGYFHKRLERLKTPPKEDL